MDEDRRLLELAAKAAGLRVRWHAASHYGPTMEIMEDEAGGPPWNPLDDDGDALRLAIRCGILLRTDFIRMLSDLLGQGMDHYAATRRAIVRVAAAIGELRP